MYIYIIWLHISRKPSGFKRRSHPLRVSQKGLKGQSEAGHSFAAHGANQKSPRDQPSKWRMCRSPAICSHVKNLDEDADIYDDDDDDDDDDADIYDDDDDDDDECRHQRRGRGRGWEQQQQQQQEKSYPPKVTTVSNRCGFLLKSRQLRGIALYTLLLENTVAWLWWAGAASTASPHVTAAKGHLTVEGSR